jgi:DNA replication protein DnaC
MEHFGISLEIPAENDKEVVEYEKKMQEREQERLLCAYKDSGVPAKFFNQSFETFIAETKEEKNVLQECMNFAAKPSNRILLLTGKNGNGKSHLGSSILRKNIYDYKGGEYITAPALCIKYDSAISFKASMNREEVIAHYSKVPVLIIDECCKYFLNTELEKFLLVTIICNRYENNLPTVLISNADKRTFIDFLGKAVYDRFTEVCTTLDFDWQSKRKSNRAVE